MFWGFARFFLLWLWIPISFLLFFCWKYRKENAFYYPNLSSIRGLLSRGWNFKVHVPFLLRFLQILALWIGVAGPLGKPFSASQHSDGLDIMLIVDGSESMQALDFSFKNKTINRLDAVKKVLGRFIRARSQDRMGLVVFGQKAFASVPLTLDHVMASFGANMIEAIAF